MIAFVQTTNVNAGGDGVGTTGNLTTTSGNFLVVGAAKDNSSSTLTITDSKTNVWVQAKRQTGTNMTVDIWYSLNIKGGASHTVTVTSSSGTDDMAFVVQEFSGVHLTNALDQTASATTTGTNPSSGATALTRGISQELVIAAVSSDTLAHLSVGAGFSNYDEQTDSSFATIGLESLIAQSAAAQTGVFVNGTSAVYACAVATFRGRRDVFYRNNIRPHLFSPGLAR